MSNCQDFLFLKHFRQMIRQVITFSINLELYKVFRILVCFDI